MENIKFSIILATLNRSNIIMKAINSILNQSYSNYEIIIVDQSDNFKTKYLIEKINNVKIKYFKSKNKGLALSRNIGLKYAEGDYMCLMDDDAEYHKDFLLNAIKYIKEDNLDLMCGPIKDKLSGEYFLDKMIEVKNKDLDKKNFLDICCSASLIIKMNFVKEAEGFDERFGVGGEFYSAEETDLVFRILMKTKKAKYIEDLLVYHPVQRGNESNDKVYKYAIGLGAFIRKNVNKDTSIKILLIKSLIKPICGTIVYTLKKDKDKRSLSIDRVRGRVKGILVYKNI